MKLITSTNSPFGARVTIAMRAKGLDLECVRPPASGIKSAEYLGINPVGRIPVLVTEAGGVIPESELIIDYLEDRFPTPSLFPRDAEQRALCRVLTRVVDTYVMTPVIRLFPQLDPTRRDAAVVVHELAHWKLGMHALAHFFPTRMPEAEAGLSIVDCILPPSLHLGTRIALMLGLDEDPMRPHGAILDYYMQMKQHPLVGQVLADLTATQAENDLKAGRPSLADRHH